MNLSQEQKDIIALLVKIGIVGTVVSIPIGLWAIPKWQDNPMMPAIILTGVGLVVKEYMIGHAVESQPLVSEMAGAPIRINPLGCGC
jgi:hypothetical protein